MPDIDIDFDERGRADVIRYVTQKWGKRQGRADHHLRHDQGQGRDQGLDAGPRLPLRARRPDHQGVPAGGDGQGHPAVRHLRRGAPPLQARPASCAPSTTAEAEVKQVIDTARGIEGLIRQPGVHAAGVIMSAEPLTDHIPVWTRNSDGAVITQFDYPTCEGLGLLKMDFLGLRNLTIMADAVKAIENNRGTKIDLLSLTLDDKPTYELLARGDTLGVFQFDGGPMRSLLRLMKPDNFEDISAVGALYRPGPMGVNSHTNYALRKNGQQEITPIHPELEEPLREILEPTYGLIVYQEQVQSAAQILAGYTLGQADLLRRAMGKKKKEILDKEFVPFQAGLPGARLLRPGDPGGVGRPGPVRRLRVQQGALRRLRPGVLLDRLPQGELPRRVHGGRCSPRVGDDKDKSALYLSECRRMGVKVLPPDVNMSVATFTAVGDDVRFGLAAIRNVGANVVEAIIAARKSKGDVHQLRRLPAQGARRGVQQASHRVAGQGGRVRLVQPPAQGPGADPRAGGRLGHRHQAERGDRPGLAVRRRRRGGGRRSRSPSPTPSGTRRPCSTSSGRCSACTSPTTRCSASSTCSRKDTDCSIAELMSANEDEDRPAPTSGGRNDGQIVKIGGILSGVQRKVTKQGNQWAAATLEDLGGAIEVLFFPQTYQLYATAIAEDAIVIVKGRVDRRDDVPEAHRHGHDRPRPHHRRQRPVGGEPAGDPLRAARGRAAPRGAAHPPRPHRGPPQAARQPEDDGGPPRRQAPRHRLACAARRSQAAPRPELHRRRSCHPSAGGERFRRISLSAPISAARSPAPRVASARSVS